MRGAHQRELSTARNSAQQSTPAGDRGGLGPAAPHHRIQESLDFLMWSLWSHHIKLVLHKRVRNGVKYINNCARLRKVFDWEGFPWILDRVRWNGKKLDMKLTKKLTTLQNIIRSLRLKNHWIGYCWNGVQSPGVTKRKQKHGTGADRKGAEFKSWGKVLFFSKRKHLYNHWA